MDTLKIGIKISEIFLKDKHQETHILIDGSAKLFEKFPFLNERIDDFRADTISC